LLSHQHRLHPLQWPQSCSLSFHCILLPSLLAFLGSPKRATLFPAWLLRWLRDKAMNKDRDIHPNRGHIGRYSFVCQYYMGLSLVQHKHSLCSTSPGQAYPEWGMWVQGCWPETSVY
jgi:hypothetical protein